MSVVVGQKLPSWTGVLIRQWLIPGRSKKKKFETPSFPTFFLFFFVLFVVV